jgi:hypothetical protein
MSVVFLFIIEAYLSFSVILRGWLSFLFEGWYYYPEATFIPEDVLNVVSDIVVTCKSQCD